MADIRVYRSKAYKSWYSSLVDKDKRIIDARLDIARNAGILNHYKLLDKAYSLYEFKWDNGLRVYFSLLQDKGGNFILLLKGGNKNSQSKDIGEAKNIILKTILSIKNKR